MVRMSFGLGLVLFSTSLHAQQCVDNFVRGGSMWHSRTYETRMLVGDADPQTVFAVVYRNFAAEGLRITNSNERSGVISALQAGGGLRDYPLNAVVRPHEGGVMVSILLTLPSGTIHRTGPVQDRFCRLLDGVSSATALTVATE